MQSDLIQFVSTLPGFRVLDEADIGRLLTVAKKRRWSDGSYIFRKGEPGDTLVLVAQGRVCVPLTDAAGRVTTKRYFERGAVLGEIALLLAGNRTADVIAEGEVRALVLSREQLRTLIRRYPPLAKFLTELLGERLERAGMNQVGKYTLLRSIGVGGSSRVYSALHPTLGRTVAIKMLSHGRVLQPGFRTEFLKEARTIASLDHPNIVRVHDVEEEYATLFLVMEQVGGKALSQMIRDADRKLPPAAAMDVLRQLAAALAYAHGNGVVHRDVKPENVAIDSSGRVKLMDFGLARRVRPEEDLQADDYFAGTPRYMAPEYIAGHKSDARVDIYALGVMAFEMVAGRRLYDTNNVDELLRRNRDEAPPDVADVAPGLPEGLVRFIRESLRKDPQRRISDWSRISDLLSDEAGGATVETVVRVRFPTERTAAVQHLLEPLMNDLAGLVDVSVASATFTEHIPGEPTLVHPKGGRASDPWVVEFLD